jgi:hypothetical protein
MRQVRYLQEVNRDALTVNKTKSFQEYSSTRIEEYKIIQNEAINKEVS